MLPENTIVRMTLPDVSPNNHDWISKIISLTNKMSNNQELRGDDNIDDPTYSNDTTNIQYIVSSICTENMVEYFSSLYKSGWLLHINKNHIADIPNKLKTYATFKSSFDMENYVKSINCQARRNFSKLRISAHHLEIETGRYTRPKTPQSERLCKSCPLNVIGDEKHFLLTCPRVYIERKLMFEKLSEFMVISNKQDFQTFIKLMNYYSGDVEVAKIVTSYVDTCFHYQK